MKKIVALAAVIAAVSFASCGNKSNNTENADSTNVDSSMVPATEVAAPVQEDTTLKANADTMAKAVAPEAKPEAKKAE